MKTVRTVQALVLALALSGMTAANAADLSIRAGAIPSVVVTAKRLSTSAKIRMTLQDVGAILKQITGTQTKSTKAPANLG